jgi:hypothetical protein
MRLLLIIACALELLGSVTFSQELDYVIDQRHDLLNVNLMGHNIRLAERMIQEFVPQADRLNVVELLTEDFGGTRTNGLGATLQIVLWKGPMNGEPLATSAPIRLEDNFSGITRFLFNDPIDLVPGAVYAIDVRLVSGDDWGVRSYGGWEWPTYPQGRYFRGDRTTDLDMWFRTGFRKSGVQLTFRDGTVQWHGVPGTAYKIWGSSDLLEWTSLAEVTSEESRFSFSPQAAHAHRFFRVSE